MTIFTLNEYETAAEMINNKSFKDGEYDKYEILKLVAKYYIHGGYEKKTAEQKLREYIITCDPTTNINNWTHLIEKAVKFAMRHKFRIIDSIEISESELKKIGTLKGMPVKRLAFTLLCLAKYFDFDKADKNHWINVEDSIIMGMANIHRSLKEQAAYYRTLEQAGLVKFSKKVNSLAMQVTFIDNEGCALAVEDMRNIGNQYMRYCGEKYIECQRCGIIFKPAKKTAGRPPKYCKQCARDVYIEQTVNSVMKRRASITYAV